jgi:LmbE family N-acetylglucosaminyl deacetylase
MSAFSQLEATKVGRAVIVSPHDDDAIVGCGGLLQSLPEKPLIVIVADGYLGYHKIEHKETLVQMRQQEALTAYARLGVPEENVLFFGFPDMSLRNYQNWVTLDGQEGGYQKLFKILRQYQPQTVFLPSEQDYHPDHRVTFDMGWVASFQAHGTLIPDFGSPAPIERLFVYQVWDHLNVVSHHFRLDEELARRKGDSLQAFESQLNIIAEFEQLGTLKYDEEQFWLFRELSGSSQAK